MYFSVLIFVLILFFLDSIRDMRKYSSRSDYVEMDAELQINVKLFRSQRNYYISGFAVFLWLVIRKLVLLILHEAELLIRNEEMAKKCQEATEYLRNLQKSTKENRLLVKFEPCDKALEEMKKLQTELDSKICELASVKQRISETKEKDSYIQQEYEELLKQNKRSNFKT